MPDRPTPPLRRRVSRWGATQAKPAPPKAKPPAPPATAEPPSAWTEAKVQAVLEALRSFISNSARKHGVSPKEVAALAKDFLCDPGD